MRTNQRVTMRIQIEAFFPEEICEIIEKHSIDIGLLFNSENLDHRVGGGMFFPSNQADPVFSELQHTSTRSDVTRAGQYIISDPIFSKLQHTSTRIAVAHASQAIRDDSRFIDPEGNRNAAGEELFQAASALWVRLWDVQREEEKDQTAVSTNTSGGPRA